MAEVKRGANPEAPYELYVEDRLVLQSPVQAVVDYLATDDGFLRHCREVSTSAFVRATFWKELPLAAKSILEWIESPNTGAKNIITIEVGKRPSLSVSKYVPKHDDNTPIVVDKGLFDTIKFYVENARHEGDDDFPYLMTEHAPGRISIWNDMPANTLKRRWGI